VFLYKKEFLRNILNNILMNFGFTSKFNNFLIEFLEKNRQNIEYKKGIRTKVAANST